MCPKLETPDQGPSLPENFGEGKLCVMRILLRMSHKEIQYNCLRFDDVNMFTQL